MNLKNVRIGIIGLGYVGLPLAVEFGKKFPTIGFDINKARVAELSSGKDHTLECSPEELASATALTFSTNADDLNDCNVYIVLFEYRVYSLFQIFLVFFITTLGLRYQICNNIIYFENCKLVYGFI